MTRVRWQPGEQRLGDRLIAELGSGHWADVWLVSAFAKLSGVLRLAPAIRGFVATPNARLTAVVGVDVSGTSKEALEVLLRECSAVWIYHNPGPSTFHPKLYAFLRAENARLFVGSNNLTAGGLFMNVETTAEIDLDLSLPDDISVADAMLQRLGELIEPASGTARLLDAALIQELTDRGLVVVEATLPPRLAFGSGGTGGSTGLFSHAPVPPPPVLPPTTPVAPPSAAPVPPTTAFVMVLGTRDTRTATGYSRDVYIPIAARDANPGFWQWPLAFARVPGTIGTYDERRPDSVLHPVGASPIAADRRLYYYHEKREFRFNAGPLIPGAQDGDLIVFERSSTTGAEYEVTVIAQGSPEYATWSARANVAVPGSDKRWGYV